MRWESLFGDLEGQMAAARGDEWRAEVSDRTRGERAAVDLPARIAASQGSELTLVLIDGERVSGALEDSAHDWLLLVDPGGRQHLVPTAAIASVSGLSASAHHLTEVERRLGVSHALRALSRDRARVRVRTMGGELHGVIAAVLADHIEVAMEGGDRPRSAVPLAALVEVVSA